MCSNDKQTRRSNNFNVSLINGNNPSLHRGRRREVEGVQREEKASSERQISTGKREKLKHPTKHQRTGAHSNNNNSTSAAKQSVREAKKNAYSRHQHANLTIGNGCVDKAVIGAAREAKKERKQKKEIMCMRVVRRSAPVLQM